MCERRIGTRLREQASPATRPARMLRASESRAAVLRRNEQARLSPVSDDEVGGSTSAMREWQGPNKNVMKNTSDQGGLRSLSGRSEF
jgi:hypothetical protein